MRIFFLIAVWAAFVQTAFNQPLSTKTSHSIIIDTDCAIDDLRAISMLVSRPEVTVKAILISDGSLPPRAGYNKVLALLQTFSSDRIPVGCGKDVGETAPLWRPFAASVKWGATEGVIEPVKDAATLLEETLQMNPEKITLVCLGPLTHIAGLIEKSPSAVSEIDRIIWYNESVQPPLGFNYEYDKEAADRVFKSGIRMDVISNLKKEGCILDDPFIDTMRKAETPLAAYLSYVHNQPSVLEKLSQKHLKLCDDLLAVYLTNPELFDITRTGDHTGIRFNQDYDMELVREVVFDMLQGTYVSERNIVFNEFPRERSLYAYDIRQIMDSAISRYGKDEWKANVMTDEFHGHLGVFSIVGAKMGIRAREFFGVGTDMLEVTSFAGSRPPYSCMNDGIQVSTGATLGMGTIHVSEDTLIRPSAIFTRKGRSVQITLKPEYLGIVDADIEEGILKFGLLDDGYWKLIRRNAIQYWLNWDRNEIFELKEIKK